MSADKEYYSNSPVRVIAWPPSPRLSRKRRGTVACKADRRFILIAGNRCLSTNASDRVRLVLLCNRLFCRTEWSVQAAPVYRVLE